jgi:hypothetical protein
VGDCAYLNGKPNDSEREEIGCFVSQDGHRLGALPVFRCLRDDPLISVSSLPILTHCALREVNKFEPKIEPLINSLEPGLTVNS